jgi:MiaB-like tRNA modifying enzyme
MTENAHGKKVYLRSFGCSSNLAEGEFMAGCLSHAGYDIATTAGEADVLIYNTCAVKTPTENRIIEILKKARAIEGKQLVITGCLPLVNYERLRSQVDFDGILGQGVGYTIVETVDRVLRKERVVLLDKNLGKKPSLDLPRIPVNPIISIVPIAQGCSGSCSYCCVVFARGRLRSCSPDQIASRIKHDLNSGAKEVWLTAQDTASYGRDIGVDLVTLLNQTCKIESEFLLRVGMMTPNFALDTLSELVEAFKDDHIFKFLHLPVQSGDEEVLKHMNRFYSVDDFKRVVSAFRKAIPDLTLATDVIAGFPGESVEAFEHTLQLIEDVEPDIVNISKFFPRPRTPAEKMPQKVSQKEIVERSKTITDLTRKIAAEKSRAWSGWRGRILIDEIGKRPQSFIGRNFAYKPIVVKDSNHSLLGSYVNVRVRKAFRTYLEAEIVD